MTRDALVIPAAATAPAARAALSPSKAALPSGPPGGAALWAPRRRPLLASHGVPRPCQRGLLGQVWGRRRAAAGRSSGSLRVQPPRRAELVLHEGEVLSAMRLRFPSRTKSNIDTQSCIANPEVNSRVCKVAQPVCSLKVCHQAPTRRTISAPSPAQTPPSRRCRGYTEIMCQR